MIKQRLNYLAAIFILNVLLITGLFEYSTRDNNNQSGFVRHLPPSMINAVFSMDLQSSDYYIAGIDSDKVYFGKYHDKSFLLQVSIKNHRKELLSISGPRQLEVFSDAYLKVQIPFLYLIDGMKGEIWYDSIALHRVSKPIRLPYFNSVAITSSKTLVLRSINRKKENFLQGQRVGQNAYQSVTPLLQKQVDGLFCTDGILISVPNSDKIIYVYYYRNQFICANSNLQLLYKGKTIDTNFRAKLKVSTLENQITLATPPVYINRQCSANAGFLFIRSEVKANNELYKAFKETAVIDVYEVNNGKYVSSFYLPDINGHKLRDFKVHDKKLIAIFDNYLYTFKLNF